MKKFIALFATIAVAISLVGCSSDEMRPNQEKEVDVLEEEYLRSLTPDDFEYYATMEKRHNMVMAKLTDEPIEKVVTKRFPISELLESDLHRELNPAFSFQIAVRRADEMFQIELLRQTSKEYMYAVYKTEEGGLFYAFFIGEDVAQGGMLQNYIYAVKSLERKDFSSLQIGDDISLVERIDPAVTPQKKWLDTQTFNDTPQIKHLLRDGLLLIDYKRSEDSYVVTDMKYYEDFKFEKDLVVFDCSVLESDYPQSIG